MKVFILHNNEGHMFINTNKTSRDGVTLFYNFNKKERFNNILKVKV